VQVTHDLERAPADGSGGSQNRDIFLPGHSRGVTMFRVPQDTQMGRVPQDSGSERSI
jgi:hypothetical protein